MTRSAAIETRLLLVAGALGAVMFVVVWLFDGATRPGYDAARLPVSALAHDIAGLVVFSALPAAAFVMAGRFWTRVGRNWLGVVSFVAGIVTLGLFVAFVIVDESDAGGAGLLQRMSIVVGWGWIGLVAVILLADARELVR